MSGPGTRPAGDLGLRAVRMPAAETALAALAAMEAMLRILEAMAREVAQSRESLAAAFQNIAARFAQVHSIAVAGEAGGPAAGGETLRALRAVVNALTVELQFEDTLGQRLGHTASRIDAANVALNEARTLMAGAGGGDPEPTGHALAVLARTLESIRTATEPGTGPRPAAGGEVDLF